ncbi:MAG TPA: hypothetical protein VFW70_08410 [Methylomirabilota bacterium]|nr:hypothetical protein [Methylomirabilota bacterium]
MKRSLVALAIVGLSAGAAAAAPGEPRVLQGTLEWPATVANEPFVVLRGEDGRLYYADISGAQRRTPDPMRSGSRIAVLGVEGARAHEIAAIAVGAGDATSLGLTPPGSMASLPSGSLPSTAVAPGPPAESFWRLDGTVQSVSGTTVTVRKADGATQAVDASPLNVRTLRALRPGDRVSFFGVPRTDRRLIANGYIQSEAPSPSASPGSTR